MPLFFRSGAKAEARPDGASLLSAKGAKRNEDAAKMKKTLDGRSFFV